MNFAQARNWLRICHSVVPLMTAVSCSASAGSIEPLQVDPWIAVDVQAFLRALIHFEIVMADDRGRRVDQPVIDQRALQQHVRRVDQPEGPGFHQRAVGRDRLEQAEQPGSGPSPSNWENRRVVPVLVEDRLGARLAIGRGHLARNSRERRNNSEWIECCTPVWPWPLSQMRMPIFSKNS